MRSDEINENDELKGIAKDLIDFGSNGGILRGLEVIFGSGCNGATAAILSADSLCAWDSDMITAGAKKWHRDVLSSGISTSFPNQLNTASPVVFPFISLQKI